MSAKVFASAWEYLPRTSSSSTNSLESINFRLFTAILIVLCLLGLLSIGIQFFSIPEFEKSTVFYFVAIGIAFVAYLMNRKGQFKLAAAIICLLPKFTCFLPKIYNSQKTSALYYFSISVVLSEILLKFHRIVGILIFNLVAIISFFHFFPDRLSVNNKIIAPIFILYIGCLILLTMCRR